MTLDEYRLLASTFAALASEARPTHDAGLRSLSFAIQRAAEVAKETDEHEAAIATTICQHYATYTRLEATSMSFAHPDSVQFHDALVRLQADAAARIGTSLVVGFVRDCAERTARDRESHGFGVHAAEIRRRAVDDLFQRLR